MVGHKCGHNLNDPTIFSQNILPFIVWLSVLGLTQTKLGKDDSAEKLGDKP